MSGRNELRLVSWLVPLGLLTGAFGAITQWVILQAISAFSFILAVWMLVIVGYDRFSGYADEPDSTPEQVE